MMHEERRQYSRKTLNPLPYINLPSDNGGIVLDVSEQGLRFRAIAPVEQSGPISFWFTAHSKLVAGIGELVWIDQAKKTYGLRFTDLPYNALEQIRKWPHDSSVQLGISQDLTMHIPAPDEFPSSSASERSTLAAVTARAASQLDRLLPESFRSTIRETRLPVLEDPVAGLQLLPPEAYFQKHKRALIRTTAALLAVIAISTSVYAYHRQAGDLLIKAGMRLSGGENTLTTASRVASQASSAEASSGNQSNADVLGAQAIPQSASATTGETVKAAPTETPAPLAQETTARLPRPVRAGTELVVQVAALTEEVEARKLSDKLRQENFQAFVGTLPVDSFYRVMLGPYTDEASARVVLGKLKRAGFSSFIRREPIAERLGS